MLSIDKIGRVKKGRGLVNYLIDHLPIELHIPGGYRWCGPGTRVAERLARNDTGINPLDNFCKSHDETYFKSSDLNKRHEADKQLLEGAWARVKAKDSSIGEKAAAWAVTNAMKMKLAAGAGCGGKKRKSPAATKKRKKGGGVVKKKGGAVRKKRGGKKKKKTALVGPRVIPIPKQGGFLQYLMPILTGITAAGTAANSANDLIKGLQKLKRGSGVLKKGKVRLAPFKRGYGLYVKPWNPGNC